MRWQLYVLGMLHRSRHCLFLQDLWVAKYLRFKKIHMVVNLKSKLI